jgi:hypothetical protein
MAASDRNSRRADAAERARQIASGEAAAFATTAGTMLLGLLTAEAVQHHGEPQPDLIGPMRPAHPIAPAPIEPVSPDQRSSLEHPVAIEAPIIPAIHAATAATVQVSSSVPAGDLPTGDDIPVSQLTHSLLSEIPVWTFSANAEIVPSIGITSGATSVAVSPPSDQAVPVEHLADTVTEVIPGLIESSLALVSDVIATIGTTVEHLATGVSEVIGGVTGSLAGLLASLTTPVAGLVEPLSTDLASPTSAPTESFETTTTSNPIAHGTSLLDTAGAIPTALLHPLPLHLGFVGQPTNDGHDTHDGAFSALGLHHF